MAFIKSEYAAGGRKAGNKLLSAAYKDYLGRLVDENTRVENKLPEGTTWADFIAFQNVRRAVGVISKENICFTAITELRETTEGKTPERMAVGGNEELAALAAALAAPPEAPTGGLGPLDTD
jgi:hypothetical protein